VAKQIAPARLAAKDLPLLQNEMCLWAQLDHPNCVKFFGVCFEPTEYYYLLCEFMPGGSLFDRHHALRAQSMRPAPPQTPQMLIEMRQIAEAMDHLHNKKILHRDLKSANVLLAEDGRLVVADFGLVRYCRECWRVEPQPTAPMMSDRATDRACLWPVAAQSRTRRLT
jgi:serine/threonine protein kinase